jgi:hypothetical protein
VVLVGAVSPVEKLLARRINVSPVIQHLLSIEYLITIYSTTLSVMYTVRLDE